MTPIAAVAALIISIFSIVLSLRGQRDALFLDLYSRWLSSEEQQYRRVVHRAAEASPPVAYGDLSAADQHSVNHAVAFGNLIAFLALRHRIRLRDVEEVMGHGLVRLVHSATAVGYFQHRVGLTGRNAWPHLTRFAQAYSHLVDSSNLEQHAEELK